MKFLARNGAWGVEVHLCIYVRFLLAIDFSTHFGNHMTLPQIIAGMSPAILVLAIGKGLKRFDFFSAFTSVPICILKASRVIMIDAFRNLFEIEAITR